MAKEEVREDVLHKTHTAIEKLPDGSCIKRVTVTRDGKTDITEEKVDCETALQDARGSDATDDKALEKRSDDFDKKMRENLNKMNQSFSDENKPILMTKEETYTDGTNKTVKLTRESSSIEETKKSEKIPDGTKRTLKITRESFVEETKKSVIPETVLPEEIKDRVKILEESFDEEANGNKSTETGDSKNRGETSADDPEVNITSNVEEKAPYKETDDDSEEDQGKDERVGDENMELMEEGDNIFTKLIKSLFKIIFYPLYVLNIL